MSIISILPQQKISTRLIHSIRYLFFLILLFPISSYSQAHFSYNSSVKAVYQLIMDLELSAAQAQLKLLKQEEPDNLALAHLENYIDFFQVYISDDAKLYKTLRSNRDDYLEKVETGPKDSPWSLYTQADIRLQWALIKFRFGDYLAGFWDVKKAYNLLSKNKKKFPSFSPNYKDLGILHALVGNIPDQYKWGAKNIVGLSGTIKEGKREIIKALKDRNPETDFLHSETIMLYSYLLLYLEKAPSEAWNVLNQYPLNPEKHILQAFTYASVAARSGHNDVALSVLAQAQSLSAWKAFPFLEFRLGEFKLRKLDSSARKHFNNYLKHYQGTKDRHAAYLRLAWCALIENKPEEYEVFCQKIKALEKASSGRDKDAVYTSKLGFIPNIDLIKARLLFDGGYYPKAQQYISAYQEKDFNSIYEKLDWLYRRGRLYHRQGAFIEALSVYNNVVERGAQQDYYFACNAALQMGLIFEHKGEFQKAKSYFKKCLALQPDIYKSSLHLAAKAGLQRIEK